MGFGPHQEAFGFMEKLDNRCEVFPQTARFNSFLDEQAGFRFLGSKLTNL